MVPSVDSARMFKTFLRPVANQSQSPLMRLPAELKLKIHRNIFKLDREKEGDKDIGSHEAPCLSTQALSTCQQLYDEAVSIIFQENVLGMNVKAELSSYTIVRTTISIWKQKLQLPAAEINSVVTFKPELHQLLTTSPNSEWLKKYSHVVARFTNVNIRIDCNAAKVFHHVCCMLRPFLWQKNVRFNIPRRCMFYGVEIPRMLLSLRCDTFDFVGRTIDAKWLDIITGTSSVVDLRDRYLKFESTIILPIKNVIRSFSMDQGDKFAFELSVFHHDETGFAAAIRAFMAVTPSRLELICTKSRKTLQKDLQKLRRDLRRSKQQVDDSDWRIRQKNVLKDEIDAQRTNLDEALKIVKSSEKLIHPVL